MGVSLVIATGSFPGTAAITVATAYATSQTIVIAVIAILWGRYTHDFPWSGGKSHDALRKHALPPWGVSTSADLAGVIVLPSRQ